VSDDDNENDNESDDGQRGSDGSGNYNNTNNSNYNNKSDSVEKPLLYILNRCATSFGRRLFKERLLTPIHDITILESRYQEIDYMLQGSKYIGIHRKVHEPPWDSECELLRLCIRMTGGSMGNVL
jgi:hypothetical protein